MAKELSLAGIQRPLYEAELGDDAYPWFRFGDFGGWIIEKQPWEDLWHGETQWLDSHSGSRRD